MVNANKGMRLVTLSTEEEGIGIATGQWLGGTRAMIAMQSVWRRQLHQRAGAASTTFRAPCLMLVTMRGQWGEFNPWQVRMGQAVRPALEAVGVKLLPRSTRPRRWERCSLRRRISPFRITINSGTGRERVVGLGFEQLWSAGTPNKIQRRPFVAELLKHRGDALVVPGLGSPTWDIFAAGNSPEYLYSWGGMGLAVPTALGIALAQPKRRVLALTGDGEMMMGIGSLAVVADQAPPKRDHSRAR